MSRVYRITPRASQDIEAIADCLAARSSLNSKDYGWSTGRFLDRINANRALSRAIAGNFTAKHHVIVDVVKQPEAQASAAT